MSKALSQMTPPEKWDVITSLIALGLRADLEGMDPLLNAPRWELLRAYNGCGPEWMSEERRARLDRALKLFAPAVLVHDWDFAHSDGTHDGFVAANKRLLHNCRALADYTYCAANPLRYMRRADADMVYAFCQAFGWSAWTDACKAKKISGECAEVGGEGDSVSQPPAEPNVKSNGEKL